MFAISSQEGYQLLYAATIVSKESCCLLVIIVMLSKLWLNFKFGQESVLNRNCQLEIETKAHLIDSKLWFYSKLFLNKEM